VAREDALHGVADRLDGVGDAAVGAVGAAARHGRGPTVLVGAPLRLLLLGGAGLVMQLGWLMIWTFSYRLTHGNDFTYTYLTEHPGVWERLHDLLVLAHHVGGTWSAMDTIGVADELDDA
jgi:hypothetical protein